MATSTSNRPKGEQGAPNLQTEQPRLKSLFGIMTGWNAALNGQADMGTVLRDICKHFDGKAATMYRLRDAWNGPRLIARAAGVDAPPPCPSLINIVLNKYRGSAVPGSIWRLSELRDEPDFENSDAARELEGHDEAREISILVLENIPGQFDFLKVSFRGAPRHDAAIAPQTIASALAEGWGLRRAGLIGQMIVDQTRRNRSAADNTDMLAPVLDDSNPYGLSRSEFRVCHLIESGMKAQQMAESLGVAEATIRSHLRSIYAKTECSGQMEVMSRLRAATPIDDTVVEMRMSASA